MFPHTPDKKKLPGYYLISHLEKKKKPKIQIVSRPTYHLPPPPAQASRVKVMQTPPNSAPRVDIVPPPNTTNNIETNTDQPIAHRMQARRTTPATPIQRAHEPVARRTCSQINPKGVDQQVDIIPWQAFQQRLPRAFIHNWAMPVMDTVTGETLEHCQLRRHPKYKNTWNQSYSNELGRLCQGIGKGSKGPKQQRVELTDTFRIIRHEDIPHDHRNKITHTKVVCKYRSHKEDPNQTRITIGRNRI